MYKTLIGTKPFRILLDKGNEFIRVYDWIRYLVSFGPEKYYVIYNRIRYLLNQKSGITYLFPHNYTRIKIDSYDSLPLEKTLTLHYGIILINSVIHKNQNHYYYNISLEKCSYKLAKN